MTSKLGRQEQPPDPSSIELDLMRRFELRSNGMVLQLPLNARRVLAFLAVHGTPLMRTYIAETLWPETNGRRAAANLRSAVWRIRQQQGELLEPIGGQLALSSRVVVDMQEHAALAHRLLDPSTRRWPVDLGPSAVAALSLELLPDWTEDWLLLERDRWNQLRLHALEALAERLLEMGNFVEAFEAALAAVWSEPLRESAHRMLIRVHAAEGNWGEAVMQYRRYRQLLDRALGASPTAQMENLIRELMPR